MTTWRIGWRNLWRNRRRTSLALAAIGLSVALVLVFDGILRWESDWLIQTITGPLLGHVQVHAPEWRKTRNLDRTLRDVSRTLEAVRADPGVAAATARVYAPALVATGAEGFAAIVLGVDIAAESRPNGLLGGVAAMLPPGHALVGKALADQMGLRPGATLAIVGQGADGSLANDLVTVDALVTTSRVDLVNRQAVLLSLGDAQTLFAMPDEAHEIVITGRDAAAAGALAARLRGLASLSGAEVLDWQTVAPGMVAIVKLVEAAWMIVLVLVLAAAASGVANTMLMATFERTHELGMLLALGTRPSRIVWLIGVESLALGVIGAAIGTVIGAAIVGVAHRYGVDYAVLTGRGPSQLTAFGMNWSLRMYPTLALVDIVRVVSAVAITSVLASAWPAIRAARLQPAQALRA